MIAYPVTSSCPDLWLSFREGSEEALRLLMKQFYGTMYNYGCKFSKNDAFIKDCIQDVFIGLWQYRQTMSLPLNTKAYLLTAVRRKMFTNKPNGMMLPLEDDADGVYLFSIEPSPEMILIEEEALLAESRVIAELLGQLSARQREVIYLKFYQGLSRDEIASVMGISDQSVSNLLQKAIHTLRKLYPSKLAFLSLLAFLLCR
jgi:RNA polymerase sigma factor (sigma-70 family)